MEGAKQKIVNRSADKAATAPVKSADPNNAVIYGVSGKVQASLKVSKPGDPSEIEAVNTAKKVMRLSIPESTVSLVKSRGGEGVFRQLKKDKDDEKKIQRNFQSPYISRFSGSGIFSENVKKAEEKKVHRKISETTPEVGANVTAEIENSQAGGAPLPLTVRKFMEPRFNADFSNVKIHTNDKSAHLNRKVGAHAFALGNNIFFGKNKFQPEAHDGKELIAHELTHTIQQGGATQNHSVHRTEDATVTQQSPAMVQRGIVGEVLDFFADKANMIPGYRMFCIIIGVNVINMSRVERSGANILRAVVELIPGGGILTQALNNNGLFDRAGAWVDQQFATLGMVGASFKAALDAFIDSLGLGDVFHLGSVWDRAKRIFTEPIGRLISFAGSLLSGFIKLIKDAILRPIASLAQGTRGWDLLCAVLGQNPVTGDPVPRTADTLIGGFMKLIGQEEIWNNIKKANAIARAWAWFQSAIGGLMGLVRSIPTRFINAFRSLELMDIILVPRAFLKIGSVFTSFIGDFISWAGNTIWSLLEIIFAVVAPGVMPYLKKAQATFRTIIRNPVGFIGNLVRAALLGFRQFSARFLTHLKNSLIQWLTGALPGVYIPTALNLREIIKFVMSVLGLTWANIRVKLVRVVGETAVKAMETGFEIVTVLVTQGPAAAWEKIKETLNNLQQMVIDGVMEFVSSRIVQAAVTRLLSMLSPAGAFIQAIIAIYNTIMFFIERLRQIAQVAASFIDSISAIANGVISTAANKVETTMAGLLTLVISFLARIAGLGKVSDAVMNIINRVRAPIDRALDRVVDWIVNSARRLGRFVAQAGLPNDPNERLRLGSEAALEAVNRFAGKKVGAAVLNPLLSAIKVRYGFTSLEVIKQNQNWAVKAVINPIKIAGSRVLIEDGQGRVTNAVVNPPFTIEFQMNRITDKLIFDRNELFEALQHHQSALNRLTVEEWLANINFKAFISKDEKSRIRQAARNFMIADLRAQIKRQYPALTDDQVNKLADFRVAGFKQHASHDADSISGGNVDEFMGLERGAVNSYLGSLWGRRRPILENYANQLRQMIQPADRPGTKMNFRLRPIIQN